MQLKQNRLGRGRAGLRPLTLPRQEGRGKAPTRYPAGLGRSGNPRLALPCPKECPPFPPPVGDLYRYTEAGNPALRGPSLRVSFGTAPKVAYGGGKPSRTTEKQLSYNIAPGFGRFQMAI